MDERDDGGGDGLPGPGARERDIAAALAGASAYIDTLPTQERRVAELAATGAPAWEIAHAVGIADAAVSRIIDGVLAAVSGRPIHPVETGGLGADTDPGVSGGYDEQAWEANEPERRR